MIIPLMNNKEAKKMYCPFNNNKCKAVKCMTWVNAGSKVGYCKLTIGIIKNNVIKNEEFGIPYKKGETK